MPITQSRLLAVIEAGAQYATAYDGLCQIIFAECIEARAGRKTWEQALTDLSLQASVNLTAQAALVLGKEKLRYDLTHTRNDREKHRQRMLRANFAHAIDNYQSPVRPQTRSATEVAATLEAEEQSTNLVDSQPPDTNHVTELDLDKAGQRLDNDTKDVILRDLDRLLPKTPSMEQN